MSADDVVRLLDNAPVSEVAIIIGSMQKRNINEFVVRVVFAMFCC
jgi:hypothetical protein